jgi:hypothetical protein
VPQGLLCGVTLDGHGIAKLNKKVARHLRKILPWAIFGHPFCWVASDKFFQIALIVVNSTNVEGVFPLKQLIHYDTHSPYVDFL